jgi:hypothetical protein
MEMSRSLLWFDRETRKVQASDSDSILLVPVKVAVIFYNRAKILEFGFRVSQHPQGLAHAALLKICFKE